MTGARYRTYSSPHPYLFALSRGDGNFDLSMPSPNELEALLARAMGAHQAGQLADAQKHYQSLLKAAPGHYPALHFLGLAYFQLGQPDRGIELIRKALTLKPDYVEAHYNLATALQGVGRATEAIPHYRQTLTFDPKNAAAHNNLGVILMQQNQWAEAIGHFESVLAAHPEFAEAHTNLAAALNELQRYEDCVSRCQIALKINARNTGAQLNLGAALYGLGRLTEALSAYQQAHALGADAATVHLGSGNTLAQLGRLVEALAAFDGALALRGDLVEAWIGRGSTLSQLNRHAEAIDAFGRALQIAPAVPEGRLGRGHALRNLKRYEEAISDYDVALKTKPGLPYADGYRVHTRRMICDWNEYEADQARLTAGIESGAPISAPFNSLSASASPAAQLKCAEVYVRGMWPVAAEPLRPAKPYGHDRIRLGYLSANFQKHAVTALIAGVFEHHDRTRFSVAGISVGADDGSAMRQRVVKGVDEFVDVRGASDRTIAERIRKMEIDILVDLMGFTEEGRPGVSALRPAPIQVNYLGYPGTMGAAFIDYILADKVVIPEGFQKYYAEKVVYLPNAYQANDRQRRIADETPSRVAAGLPDSGFVFCSFNNSYKINPPVFDVWMRLLCAVPGSVLWLLEDNATASRNLRDEAQKRGVAAERLVFAERRNPDEHLARHRLADLFLDTSPYNAHTTASDALWTGLPVLTCVGSTFAARVASSLLQASGLPELVTTSMEEYEAHALLLARDAAALVDLKGKLAANRLNAPLFDTERTTRDLEAAYVEMQERCGRGLAPASFHVPART